MGLVAIPIVVGGAALITWLSKISGPSLPKSQATVRVVSKSPDLPPLKTFTENEVFGKPPAAPPPPTPAPVVAPPPPSVAEKLPAAPPPPKVEASPLPAKVTPAAPPPAAPAVEVHEDEDIPPAAPFVPNLAAPQGVTPIPLVPPAPPPPPPVAAPPVAAPPPVAAMPPAALPPAPVVQAPTVADVATPPPGFDRALATKLAKSVADSVSKKSYDYDKALTKRFQVAAGIPADGNYGPETKGAALYYGIRRPPRALFKGADGTYNEVPYKWA